MEFRQPYKRNWNSVKPWSNLHGGLSIQIIFGVLNFLLNCFGHIAKKKTKKRSYFSDIEIQANTAYESYLNCVRTVSKGKFTLSLVQFAYFQRLKSISLEEIPHID